MFINGQNSAEDIFEWENKKTSLLDSSSHVTLRTAACCIKQNDVSKCFGDYLATPNKWQLICASCKIIFISIHYQYDIECFGSNLYVYQWADVINAAQINEIRFEVLFNWWVLKS